MIDEARSLARRLGGMRIYRPARQALVTRRAPHDVWSAALPDEVIFWRDLLPERVASDTEFQRRMRPDAPLQHPLQEELVAELPGSSLRAIDVGSGPLSALGRRAAGKHIEVVAADPLADEYLALLRDQGIEPPVRLVACAGERLLERFEPESFDLAYARNSVDHGYDPLRTIENMVALVRRPGLVVLEHARNEAHTHAYRHLHQWNLDVRAGKLVLGRGRELVDVTERVAAEHETQCYERGGWFVWVLRKR